MQPALDDSSERRDFTSKQPENKYYPRLDSIRAVCALGLIFYHWGTIQFGWIGVEVFFVLSGLLITESLLKTKAGKPTQRSYLVYFFQKRALRLFPLYYGFLFVMGILYLLIGWPAGFGADAPYLFTYTLNLIRMVPGHPLAEPYSHLWSLGVEWQFYLLWPFFVWKLSEKSLVRLSIALILITPLLRCVTLLAASLVQVTPVAIAHICYMAGWSHWDALAMGALLTRPEIRAWIATRRVSSAIVALFVLGGMFVIYEGPHVHTETLGYPIFLSFSHEAIWGYTLIDLLAACLIVQTAAQSWVATVTDLKWLQYLGKISYGLYVYHYPLVLLGVEWLGHTAKVSVEGVAILIFIIAADIGIAHLSYQYYESWFLRRKSTLSTTPKLGAETSQA